MINVVGLSVNISVAGTQKKMEKILKNRKVNLKYFLCGCSKINWAMVNKDGSFNSTPFQCKKVKGIMSVFYNRVQEENKRVQEEEMSLIVHYPFIDTVSPGGTLYSPK